MVGKRLHSVSPSTSKRSPVLNVEPALANRPKRNISPKNLDLNSGLSWREERELKKALYASLQEVKRPYLKSEEETTSYGETCSSSSVSNQTQLNESDDAVSSRTRRQSSRQTRPSLQTSSMEVTPVKSTLRSTSLDESSQDSLRSSLSNSTQDSLKKDEEKKKYRAQRKFAQMQGYSPSSTPNHTPVKLISKTVSPMKLFPKRAKTEDFLTFLCLRGTSALPPHLDFFNYLRDDGDSSYPATPSNGRPGSAMRDSSPSSSSTGCSNIQEEGFDPTVLPVVPKLMTPNRKAARACAGTPEIARGFASVSPKKHASTKASPLSGRKQSGKYSLDITPSKQIAKRSITSPRKLSPLRKSSIRSLTKTKTSDRITMKRKAVATLTSVARISPKKALRKKASYFNEASSSLLSDIEKVNYDVVCSSQSMNDSCNLASNPAVCNRFASSAHYIDYTHVGDLNASTLPNQPCLNACSSGSSSDNNKGSKTTELTSSKRADLSVISDNNRKICQKETGLQQDNKNVMPSFMDFTVNLNKNDNIVSHLSSDALKDDKISYSDLSNNIDNFDDSDAELSGFLMYADDTANTDIKTQSDAVSSCGSELSFNSLRDTPPFLVSDKGYRLTPDMFEANNNNLHVTSTFMNHPSYSQQNDSINMPEENKNKPNIIGPTVTSSNCVSVLSQCPSRASASILPQPAPPYSAINSFHKIVKPDDSLGDHNLLEGFTPIGSSSKCNTKLDSSAKHAGKEVLDNRKFHSSPQTSSENKSRGFCIDVNSNVMPSKEMTGPNSALHFDKALIPVNSGNFRKALQPSPPAIMCTRQFYN